MRRKVLRKACIILPIAIMILLMGYSLIQKEEISSEQKLTIAGIVLLMYAISSITYLFARKKI